MIDSAIEITKVSKDKSIYQDNPKILNKLTNKNIDRIIIKRNVEKELLSHLFTIKTKQLNKTTDSRYGKGVCSDFQLFDDKSPIISKLSFDIKKICKEEIGIKEMFISDSFFNIFISGSGQPPHNHIKNQDIRFKMYFIKYSLVYYLDIGDQKSKEPGLLKLHNPEEEILPSKGMIVIISGNRSHSVSYNGNKQRVMIGVNFYGL